MLPPTAETVGFRTTICMLDFVYVVTFEYNDEFKVVGAAGLYREAKDLIEKIIDSLPAKDNTEERKNKDNYYITGTSVFTEYKGHLYN